MKGFETGIMVRSKGGKMDEFGCKSIESSEQEKIKSVIDMLAKGIESIAAIQANIGTKFVNNALKMLTEFLTTVNIFVNALNPKNDIDLYCRGMIFGLYGSTMVVKFANIVMKNAGGMTFKPVPSHEEGAGGRKSKWVPNDPIGGAIKNILGHGKEQLMEGVDEEKGEL